MGKKDNRRSRKMLQKRGQKKKKLRLKKRISASSLVVKTAVPTPARPPVPKRWQKLTGSLFKWVT